jgi:drug/metabolite transporter (DMT)-like permease
MFWWRRICLANVEEIMMIARQPRSKRRRLTLGILAACIVLAVIGVVLMVLGGSTVGAAFGGVIVVFLVANFLWAQHQTEPPEVARRRVRESPRLYPWAKKKK